MTQRLIFIWFKSLAEITEQFDEIGMGMAESVVSILPDAPSTRGYWVGCKLEQWRIDKWFEKWPKDTYIGRIK